MELRKLEIGKQFELAGYDWIVLEHDAEKGSTLITTKECIEEMAFDEDGSNDFRNSSLRHYLNNDFLEELQEDGLDEENILLTDFDLTNSDGENIYGLCRDKIGLLTQGQYIKYRDILALNDWWWLITPSASYSRYVRTVYTSGTLSYDNALHGLSGVRPLCNLKSDTIVIANNEEIMNDLDVYSSEELLEELLRREREAVCLEDTEDGGSY